ncbi:MAG: PilZ domain-containing protein [Thermodesulfobacteriota bacterium]
MKPSNFSVDRRTSPRVWMYLPLEYQLKHAPRARGGIVIDANETGFHIYSTENIPIGTRLRIDVLFPKKYELANFQVVAEIVWKKVSVDTKGKGFQYGVKFVQIFEEDSKKLKALLSDRSTSEEISDPL